jgi:hypothetical protein
MINKVGFKDFIEIFFLKYSYRCKCCVDCAEGTVPE